MKESTKQKLIYYFHLGFSVAQARQALQRDLLKRFGEKNYDSAKSDGAFYPSSSAIQYFFQKLSVQCSEGATGKDLNSPEYSEENPETIVFKGKLKNLDSEENLDSEINIIKDEFLLDVTSTSRESIPNVEMFQIEEDSENSSSQDDEICSFDCESAKKEFTEFCAMLIFKMDKDPKAFVPAVRQMMQNANKYAKTDSEMASALSAFAEPKNYLALKDPAVVNKERITLNYRKFDL